MSEKLDLDALERSTEDGNGGTKSVMWFDGYVLRKLISRIRELERAQHAGLSRNAERYRWLRGSGRLGDDDLDGHIVVGEAGAESLLWGEQLDRAAPAAQREGGA